MRKITALPHATLENVEIVVRKRDYEYEVVPKNAGVADENATYYTDDLDDALGTADVMAATYRPRNL